MEVKADTPNSVYDYSDYRTFLRDRYQAQKKRNPKTSYESFSRKLGLADNSTLIKILQGQREAGATMVAKVSHALKFTPAEQEYFQELVKLSKGRANAEKFASSLTKLKTLHPKKSFRVLTDLEFFAISNWWYYAIRQMTNLGGFKADPDWIAPRLQFKCDKREIRLALKTLEHLELIRIDSNTGRAELVTRSLDTSTNLANEGIKRFHEQMLLNARDAIRSVDVRERFLTGMTFGIRGDAYERATQKLNQFLDEFTAEFESTDPQSIYQVQLQFFPLTKNLKEEL